MKHATLCMNADGYGLGGRIVVLVIVLGILAWFRASFGQAWPRNNRWLQAVQALVVIGVVVQVLTVDSGLTVCRIP